MKWYPRIHIFWTVKFVRRHFISRLIQFYIDRNDFVANVSIVYCAIMSSANDWHIYATIPIK